MLNPGHRTCRRIALLFALLALVLAAPASALEPEELLLIVNAKSPEGRELAEVYARARRVPDGRILELDLPFPAEQMTRAAYEADVIPTVRQFLTESGLAKKVTCAVTFYGVPLRVEGRANTPDDEKEAATLDEQVARIERELTADVEALEKLAAAHDSAFKPAPAAAPSPPGGRNPMESPQAAAVQALGKRADAAMGAALGGIAKLTDREAKQDAVVQLRGSLEKLAGKLEAVLKLADPKVGRALGEPVTREEVERSKAQLASIQRRLAERVNAPGASAAENRELSRRIARDNLGSFKYLVLLVQQRQTFETGQSEAAFDSELALVAWNGYPLAGWQLNPLHHRMAALKTPPVMMVTRLDGPSPDVVRRMIETSVKVEQEGLSGNVVLDARGKAPPDAYGKYDQTIRLLGQIVRTKTQLPLIIDDTESVFLPGSQQDVALYCGWYSLRNYVPAFAFKPGAIGFHIASAELVSLRGDNERGWVRNLLNDGVVATVGPVAEPYLHSFPAANEFFPLLMTGRLTLAEAYWKSNPLTSWMNTCIGDPLYAPFKAKPALKPEDLPEPLRAAAAGPPSAARGAAAGLSDPR